ncbi:IclR family transcriptional regulator [Robbsia sp. KACC 23696]|uniref:IclR family transcriptional regulator n=1 Tax=Robbsia sp. KACC 23696 TaxID=3149231 RepID=UPI00325AC4AA
MSILDTASDVLRLMARRQTDLTMTDLVDQLGMPKSTASRVLKQMTETGLLARDPVSLAYRPSMLVLELGHLVRAATPLIDMCGAALETLCGRHGHTGYVSLLEGQDVVVLKVRPGSQALRAMTNPGHRSASWATSTGRALLARETDDAVRERFRAGLPALDASEHRGPASVDALLAELALTRTRGYALAQNEAMSGVCSIGCSVADAASGERLAFCLSFPAGTLEPDSITALGRDVRAQAAQIGRALGDPFWTTALLS